MCKLLISLDENRIQQVIKKPGMINAGIAGVISFLDLPGGVYGYSRPFPFGLLEKSKRSKSGHTRQDSKFVVIIC